MPEEHPDAEPSSTPPPAAGAPGGSGTTRGGSPKPGHFMPGGAGDILTDGDRARAAERRQSLDLGKARSVSAPIDPTLRKKARPLPPDPGTEPGFGAPPPAPMAGGPVTPLSGTRRTGSSRPVGWHSPSSRTGAQFSATPPPITPPRQYSKAVIAGLTAFAVLLVAGGTFAGFKLISSYDNVDSPMARPEVKETTAPIPVPPDPTVTVTVQPVPDLVRLRQNKLYTVGKVPSVNCKEPAIKPNSQSAILKYYNALLPCLNKAWAPLVQKAGYTFHPPKLVLQSKQPKSTCEKDIGGVGYYCETGDVISLNWQADLANYRKDPVGTRVWMMDAIAGMYGFHVQYLTEILTAVMSRKGWAKTEPEKLEWTRRRGLQAECLGSAFLGANKKSLGLTGDKLDNWEYQEKRSGDDDEPKKPRIHGSFKNNWLWSDAGFKSTSPGSCNTFAAAANKVS